MRLTGTLCPDIRKCSIRICSLTERFSSLEKEKVQSAGLRLKSSKEEGPEGTGKVVAKSEMPVWRRGGKG